MSSDTPLQLELADQLLIPAAETVYGAFLHTRDISAKPITGLDKPSGWIRAEIVQCVDTLAAQRSVAPLLLPGENNRVKIAYTSWLCIEESDVETAGLDSDVDHRWDFECDPPITGTYSCIISQAMLEHLIDPYKHVRDCYSLLSEGGSLVLSTPVAGFPYHRYPIDSLRLMPDWFEEVAERLNATITMRFLGQARQLYCYRRMDVRGQVGSAPGR